MICSQLNFLQINLQGSRLAQDLLWTMTAAKEIGVAIVSEPYNVSGIAGWYTDRTGWAAIGIPDGKVVPREVEQGDGFVAIVLGACTVYSCYISPNSTLNEYKAYLNRLATSLFRRQGQPLIVAGDFNAKSEEWQAGRTDQRGYELGEWLINMQLQVANVGDTPTRFHNGFGSRIDVTFATDSLARKIRGWKVLDREESGSDHRYISFSLHRETEVTAPKKVRRWATRKLNTDQLKASYLALTWDREASTGNECVATSVDSFIETVTAACDSAMPRSKTPRKRGPVYWWNEEIAQLRKESSHQRRRYQRCRGREEAQMVAEQYQQARRRLKAAIKASKKAAWEELKNLADEDPFGKPYKVIMKKLGGSSVESRMEPEDVEEAIDKLFPQLAPIAQPYIAEVEDVPALCTAEVDAAIERCKTRKWRAPGPDQIPNAVWCVIHEVAPLALFDVFNKTMQEGVFIERWKKARLALIPKPGKPPDQVRPLCLLDTLSKLFERIVLDRLDNHLVRKKVLSNSQYGFRTERSTADAALKLKMIAARAIRKRQFCAAVSLDIKNAFNSMPWPKIIEALANARVPVYLQKILRSYLDCRWIEAETSAGTVTRAVTAGVPQGSVLGPTLWNVAFNGILKLLLPPGVQLICYADDTLVVACADTVAEVESRVNQALEALTKWIELAELELAVDKTEVMLFTKRRKFKPPVFKLAGKEISVSTSFKYLGLWFDKSLSFRDHLRYVAEKANKKVAMLSRLMSNLGGPREAVRQLYLNVTLSILLYGAPVWAESMKVLYRSKEMVQMQRKAAMRCVCAYRTVSTEAVCILARTPPIDLLAEERAEVYKEKKKAKTKTAVERVKRDARSALLQKWKERLASSEKGEWTRTLICDLEQWMSRTHGQLNFHLTQVLSGHGCFNQYLFKMGIIPDPQCSHCSHRRNDGPQHTLFECVAWRRERDKLVRSLEQIGIHKPLSPGNLVPIMLESGEAWNLVSGFASTVMKKKMEAEWARQIAERR